VGLLASRGLSCGCSPTPPLDICAADVGYPLMDLESWKVNLKRHLESVQDDTLLMMCKLVLSEMERRRPTVAYKPPSDAEFLRSCGVRWD
jgi:hypothetical protein